MLENSKWRVWSSDFKCDSMLLDEMTRRLVQEFQPEQVILFGSHAWGIPNQDSDIDLMVVVKEAFESDYERMLRGYRCLSGINIPKEALQELAPNSLICHSEERGICILACSERFLVPRNDKFGRFWRSPVHFGSQFLKSPKRYYRENQSRV